MGNGMPISAVGGREDIMNLIDKGCFISTTFGGETLSIAAALETIKILEKPGILQGMWEMGMMAKNLLQEFISLQKVEEIINVVGTPARNGVTFNDYLGFDYLDYASLWNETMLDFGILTHGINYYMTCMTEYDIYRYLNAADSAIIRIRKAAENSKTDLRGSKLDPIFKRGG